MSLKKMSDCTRGQTHCNKPFLLLFKNFGIEFFSQQYLNSICSIFSKICPPERSIYYPKMFLQGKLMLV